MYGCSCDQSCPHILMMSRQSGWRHNNRKQSASVREHSCDVSCDIPYFFKNATYSWILENVSQKIKQLEWKTVYNNLRCRNYFMYCGKADCLITCILVHVFCSDHNSFKVYIILKWTCMLNTAENTSLLKLLFFLFRYRWLIFRLTLLYPPQRS